LSRKGFSRFRGESFVKYTFRFDSVGISLSIEFNASFNRNDDHFPMNDGKRSKANVEIEMI